MFTWSFLNPFLRLYVFILTLTDFLHVSRDIFDSFYSCSNSVILLFVSNTYRNRQMNAINVHCLHSPLTALHFLSSGDFITAFLFRNFPEEDYMPQHGRKGPLSKTVTLTAPYNPYNKVGNELQSGDKDGRYLRLFTGYPTSSYIH